VGGLSEVSSFSFYPGKNLGAYGEGGAVLTNNADLAQLLKMLREHGQSEKYHHETFGHNYRMDGIQGAVLNVKLKYLDEWTNKRREAANKYRELLKNTGNIILPEEMSYAKHVYHLFVVRIGNNGSDLRSKLIEFLKEQNISTGLHYPVPLHRQKCFKFLDYKKGDFPVTERLASTGLSLPIFPEITDEQLEYTAERIRYFFSSKYSRQVA